MGSLQLQIPTDWHTYLWCTSYSCFMRNLTVCMKMQILSSIWWDGFVILLNIYINLLPDYWRPVAAVLCHLLISYLFHWCVLSGSNTSSDAPCLELEFENAQPVSFPSHDKMEEYARSLVSESTWLAEATKKHSEVDWWWCWVLHCSACWTWACEFY